MIKHSSESRRGISLQTVKTRKADWIGHVLCMNRILKHITEGKIEAKLAGRRGRKHNQLIDELKEKRGYCKLKEEALARTLVENSLWKRLWTFLKTQHNEC